MLFIQLLKKYTPKGEMANMSKNESAFSEIEIDHSDIPQGDLNIDIKTRSNLFNWNGQFSPQFIEALEVYSTKYGLKDETNYYLSQKDEYSKKYDVKQIPQDKLYKIYNNLGDPYDIIDDIRGENIANHL